MTEYITDLVWEKLNLGNRFQHRWFQYLEIVVVMIAYVIIMVVGTLKFAIPIGEYTLASGSNTLPDVVVGSLIGAFPLFLMGVVQWRKRPHIKLIETTFTKYPAKWRNFDDNITSTNTPGSSICMHTKVRNDGLETAQKCRISLGIDKLKNTFSLGWGEMNNPTVDLAAGERARVDLLWIRLDNLFIQIPTPEDDSEYYPKKDYPKTTRHDIPLGSLKFRIEISARTMRQQSINVNFDDSNTIKIPEDAQEHAEDWDVVRTLKEQKEEFAVLYTKPEKDILEVPEDFDLVNLVTDPAFDTHPDIELPERGAENSEYQKAAKEAFEIKYMASGS